MALVCFLKSVVALPEGMRKQREKSGLEAEIKIFTGESEGEVRLRETAGMWMLNKPTTEEPHSEYKNTGGRQNNSSALSHTNSFFRFTPSYSDSIILSTSTPTLL